MIRQVFTAAVAILGLSACATSNVPVLSGPIALASELPTGGLRIGLVADSQLQTRGNYDRVFGYRGPFEDFIVKTSVRPPALDWAARSMLRSDLERLRAEGAQAVFYLGDGANNGCYDEFALGFRDGVRPAPNDQGVLALLDEFRSKAGIPVFFILGNHDILGAGSTAQTGPREAFCRNPAAPNHSVTKLEAMRLADAFNRGNASVAGGWTYRSSWDEAALTRSCGTDPRIQHRTRGCWLAAAIDHQDGGRTTQFLLLDTNDWADVTDNKYAGLEQEGIRGAMSFADRPGQSGTSQTSWFERNAAEHVDLRVALSHYDVAGLTKSAPLIGQVSRKSQRYMSLFTAGGDTRTPIQGSAYVATGHTHTRDVDGKLFTFKMDCGRLRCAKTNRFRIRELNVGSTTDYSNYATIVSLGGHGLTYRRVESEPTGCADVWSAIPQTRFARQLKGGFDTGWQAIGIDRSHPRNYHDLSYQDVEDLWANLDGYAGGDPHRANCIGLYAAAVEAGVDPLRRLPPRR